MNKKLELPPVNKLRCRQCGELHEIPVNTPFTENQIANCDCGNIIGLFLTVGTTLPQDIWQRLKKGAKK